MLIADINKNADFYKKMILERARSQELLLKVNNETVLMPVRMPNVGEYCFIDYVSFVCDIDDLVKDATYVNSFISTSWAEDVLEEAADPTSKNHAIEYIAKGIGETLAGIFGEDVDDVFSELEYTGRGLHSYKCCLNIGTRENLLGKVCFGGQNNTVLVMITGFGCSMAVAGWETHLYHFLKNCKKGYLTRVDLAHDDFNGDYSSVDDADEKESQDFFYISGTKPKVQQLGDWKYNLGDGRTLQIGKRQNGKMFRGYEKGRQLGDVNSNWFRVEVELRNQGRFIPLEILTSPTEYFTGFYPYTAQLIDDCRDFEKSQDEDNSHGDGGDDEIMSKRIPVIVKTGEISLKKSLQIWQKQIGRYILAYRQFFGSDSFILDLLQGTKKLKMPPRLSIFTSDKISDFLPSITKKQIELIDPSLLAY